jgi:peptide/nickel transport system permease protein
MFNYIIRRLFILAPMLLLVSFVTFFVIQLQPTSFIDTYLADPRFTRETVKIIERQYGLDQPLLQQYGQWVWGIITRGDFGFSFNQNRSVASIIGDYIVWTLEIASISLIFSWVVAIPLGVFTAVNRNGITDAIASFVGYIGLAIPDFLMALLLFAIIIAAGGTNVGGLFSKEFIGAPWTWAKFWDHLNHLWPVVVVFGLNHIAALQRQMRASMLDVLNQDYIRTARSKGLRERIVVYRHAVRNAINPLVSAAGLSIAELASGSIVGAVAMNLPTIGPLLYDALGQKDQYLVMTMLLFSAFLLMVGNLLADVALALVDPRIRFE